MSPKERINELTKESRSLRICALTTIMIGISIAMFGTGSILGAVIKNVSPLLIFRGIFYFFMGVVIYLYSRLPGGIRNFNRAT